MTQNEKYLLLKDLCARLPYGVICKSVNFKNPTKLVSIDLDGPAHDVYFCTNDDGSMWQDYDEIKPYLFPLSSMTEEQSIELFKLFGISLVDSIGADYIKINECTGITFFLDKGFDIETHLDKLTDWLNKNNFDYRGLIPLGLAIDATNKNIY